MKIVLLGYMASGKSTIGKILAKKLELKFIDLDDFIEEQEKLTISEIFNSKGEIYFRKQEHIYLKELLNSSENFILSLGGGTPCYAGNMDIINKYEDVKSVYIKVSIKTIYNRLLTEKNKRPLVANISSEELEEYIAKHLFERSYFYNKAALKINSDDSSPENITDKIYSLLT